MNSVFYHHDRLTPEDIDIIDRRVMDMILKRKANCGLADLAGFTRRVMTDYLPSRYGRDE